MSLEQLAKDAVAKEEADKKKKPHGVPGAPITLQQQQILASALLKVLDVKTTDEALKALQTYNLEKDVARKNAYHNSSCASCKRFLYLRTHAVGTDPDFLKDLFCSKACCPSGSTTEGWVLPTGANAGASVCGALQQFLLRVDPTPSARPVLGKDEPGVYDFGEFAEGQGHSINVEEVLKSMHENAFEEKYEEYSKVHFGKDFSTEGGVILNTYECLKLQSKMGRDGQGGLYVRRVAQCAGQAVVVPPGWSHQVVNVQERVKFGIDFYDIGNASLYMDLARDVAAKVFGKRNAQDYMGAAAVIVNAIVALMGWQTRR
ncbi:g5391 [Coccomyxa elongata]